MGPGSEEFPGTGNGADGSTLGAELPPPEMGGDGLAGGDGETSGGSELSPGTDPLGPGGLTDGGIEDPLSGTEGVGLGEGVGLDPGPGEDEGEVALTSPT